MSEDQASSSISSSPEPPEPMDLEDMQETGAGGLEEAVREAVEGQTKEEDVDLKQVAREFAEYLVVDSKQDVSNIPLFRRCLYELRCNKSRMDFICMIHALHFILLIRNS